MNEHREKPDFSLFGNQEFEDYIKEYLKELLNSSNNTIFESIRLWLKKENTSKNLLSTIAEREIKFKKKLELIIYNSYKNKLATVQETIIALKTLEERLSFESNFRLGGIIIIPFIAPVSFAFVDFLLEIINYTLSNNFSFVAPGLKVLLSLSFFYIAYSTVDNGWKIKKLAINIKCISILIEKIIDEIESSET